MRGKRHTSCTYATTTHLSLICLAMVKNACSTLVAFFADVSRKGIESWSAKSWEIEASNPVSAAGE